MGRRPALQAANVLAGGVVIELGGYICCARDRLGEDAPLLFVAICIIDGTRGQRRRTVIDGSSVATKTMR